MKIIVIVLLFPFALLSDEYIPCTARIEILNFSKLGMQNCDLTAALVDSLGLRDYHQKKLYEMLAQKLATQVEQNMEEMALLDQFYSYNDAEIPFSNDVKRDCRLDILNETAQKCGGEKLELLTKNLSTEGATLFEQLTNKFTNTLNIGEKSRKKTCPLQEATNDFIISSQMDYFTANKIIRETKMQKIENITTQAYYDQFPQLKLIAKSGDETKQAFQNYLLQFNGLPKDAQKYIAAFFTDKKNATALSKGIANQCALINKNVSTFLCRDLVQLGSLEPKVSMALFSGLEPRTDLDEMDRIPKANTPEGELFFSAYGFQCLAQKQTPLQINQSENIDQWYLNFTKNIRPNGKTGGEFGDNNINFCQIYTCSKTGFDQANHCPNGKHPTSQQLSEQYNCPTGKTCSEQISQFVAYLAILDKEEGRKYFLGASQGQQNSSQSSQQSKGSSQVHYSSFSSNLLGFEGIKLAEGKTPLSSTSLALTPRSKDSSESTNRSLEATPKAVKGNREKAPRPSAQTASQFSENHPQTTQRDFTTSSMIPEQTIRATEAPPSTRATSVRSTSSRLPSTIGQHQDSSNESDIRKLRDELEAVTNSLKGNGAEKVAAIADNNARFSPESLGGVAKGSEFAGLNNAERERLDQYQRNLNSWENKLRNWQSDLSTRETRIPTSTSATATKTPEAGEMPSQALKSGSGDSALQLTASEGDKGKKSGTKLTAGAAAAMTADSPEAIVTSEELALLKLDNLKKLGINYKSAFIMKIKYQQKFYDVPVKAFTYKGKDILVPLLTEQNSILSKVVLESPLFSDYKQLQIERQKERQEYSRVI